MMTKRDFEAIAHSVSALADMIVVEQQDTFRQWARLDLVPALARLNPAFDRERFLKACGVPSTDS